MAGTGKRHGEISRGSGDSRQIQLEQAADIKVESPGEATRLPKLKTEGASIGSENGAEFRSAYNEAPFGRSLLPMKNEMESHKLVKEEKVDTETKYVPSPSPGDSTAKASIINYVYYKRRRKHSNGTEKNTSTPSTGVPMTNASDADKALVQTSVQANVVNPNQGKANNTDQLDPNILLGQNLDIWEKNIDLSSAESFLTSLYGDSERDLNIEFAVKLLMGETSLPKEAAEVEEFFRQKMNSEKSRTSGPSRSQ